MKCRYFCRLPLDISPVYLTRGISKSEVTALSIAGIRVPEMKKAPSHLCDLCATSNSYSIIQISSNYAKLPQPKKRGDGGLKSAPKTPPKSALG